MWDHGRKSRPFPSLVHEKEKGLSPLIDGTDERGGINEKLPKNLKKGRTGLESEHDKKGRSEKDREKTRGEENLKKLRGGKRSDPLWGGGPVRALLGAQTVGEERIRTRGTARTL